MAHRRLPSELANKLISTATGVKLHDYGCSLKVFRSEVVKPLKLYGEMHRFLPAIASEMGVTISEMVVNHRARKHGQSKYGLSRTFRVVLDLATVKFLLELFDAAAADVRPHRRADGLAGIRRFWPGFPTSACSATSRLPTGRCCCFGVLLIFTGVQLVTMGLLAEIMARTYHESQDKPTYAIREIRQSVEPPRPRAIS